LAVLLVCIGILCCTPLALQELFFRLPSPSAGFDCDDATLLTCERLENAGISATAILGDLKKSGETYSDSNHVWVLVNIAGKSFALDWGAIYLDSQHREGYPISRQQLLEFVAQDMNGSEQTPANR
jgi:hypothetical protein